MKKIAPHFAVQLLEQQGDTLRAAGRPTEALGYFDAAIAASPASAALHCKRGQCLHTLRRFSEALESFDRGIALQPSLAPAHMDRANTLQEVGRLEEALASYDRAIALAPRYADLHCNRGTVLHRLHRMEESVASYDTALRLAPGHEAAAFNRSTALADLGRNEEALEGFARTLRRHPELAVAHWNEAISLLRLGRMREGWARFEWRFRYNELSILERKYSKPRWRGETPIESQTILLYAEQGLGDAIQFCRYAPVLAGLGARVVLEAPAPLFPLLQSLAGVATLVREGDPLPDFDHHCPLLSLPLALDTGLDSIPARVPYLRVDPARRAAWADRLGTPQAARPRVGLAWSGNPGHPNDYNRSMPIDHLLALRGLPIELVSLQKDVRDRDRPALLELGVRHFGDALEDVAAAIAELDLVISVDTGIAHLAGALARPTWLLLPFAPDWRWLLDREDSPWYPGARLIRQTAPGDWAGVAHRVIRDLQVGIAPAPAVSP